MEERKPLILTLPELTEKLREMIRSLTEEQKAEFRRILLKKA